MKYSLHVAAAIISFAALVHGGPAAHATLLGDSVTLDYMFPDASTVFTNLGTASVTPTATFNSFGQTQYVVSNTTLDITNTFGNLITFTAASFNGVRLTDLTSSDITNVVIDAATNLVGFAASDVSFDSSHIFVNLEDLVTNTDTLVRLDITTGAAAVPEPSSLALLSAGLTGIVLLRRRRRHTA